MWAHAPRSWQRISKNERRNPTWILYSPETEENGDQPPGEKARKNKKRP
jgi:hypothetical protein